MPTVPISDHLHQAKSPDEEIVPWQYIIMRPNDECLSLTIQLVLSEKKSYMVETSFVKNAM